MRADTPSRFRPTLHRQCGLSLIELMISITIGLLLLIGITQLIVAQTSARAELEKSSRQIENGRYAIQILQDDIQLAGYYATYFPPGNAVPTAPDACGPTWNQGWVAGSAPQVALPFFGYSGTGVAPLPCLANYQPNTAILVVRHAGTATASTGAAQDAQLLPTQADGTSTYLQVSHCPTEVVANPFVLGTAGFNLHEKNCTILANIFKYYVRIYYISSCDNCAAGDNIPTLKMVENNGIPVPVVEGVENMQFDYGLDSLPPADGYPDTWTTSPAAADWPNVMAIRVNILARNNEPSVGYQDVKTYCLTGVGPLTNGLPNACSLISPASNVHILPKNDGYRRHLYSQIVRAINPMGRRANP